MHTQQTGIESPAFEEVLRTHAGLISRIALSHEADPGYREDLTQEIVVAIWRALPSFRGESSLRTFVASVAQKRAITHVSQHARQPKSAGEVDMELAADTPLPDEMAIASDKRQRLLTALQSLSLPQREVATLMLEGFSYDEIAESLGVTANAAMLRCQRAKAALTAMMTGAAGGS